jgi:hypothetical protein
MNPVEMGLSGEIDTEQTGSVRRRESVLREGIVKEAARYYIVSAMSLPREFRN